jgi:thymidylate synthase
MRFDLSLGFPLVTTKKLHFPSILHELLWFLRGDTNISYLKENKVRIWNEWATENGDIGPLYGKQWTCWANPDGSTINQIQQAVDLIKSNPNSRRIIVTAWNPSDLPDESISPQENVHNGKMALATCHSFFQFYVSNNQLSLQLYQRSGDAFLGIAYNLASYSILLHMMAQQTNLEVGCFIHTIGDAHIYNNHQEQVDLQLSRTPTKLPTLTINRKPNSIFDYKFEDFTLHDYNPHPHIAGKVAI